VLIVRIKTSDDLVSFANIFSETNEDINIMKCIESARFGRAVSINKGAMFIKFLPMFGVYEVHIGFSGPHNGLNSVDQLFDFIESDEAKQRFLYNLDLFNDCIVL
jgi:hypothetical protein